MDFQLPILHHPNVLSSWNNNAFFHFRIIKYENHRGIFVVPISNVHFSVLTHGIPNFKLAILKKGRFGDKEEEFVFLCVQVRMFGL